MINDKAVKVIAQYLAKYPMTKRVIINNGVIFDREGKVENDTKECADERIIVKINN